MSNVMLRHVYYVQRSRSRGYYYSGGGDFFGVFVVIMFIVAIVGVVTTLCLLSTADHNNPKSAVNIERRQEEFRATYASNYDRTAQLTDEALLAAITADLEADRVDPDSARDALAAFAEPDGTNLSYQNYGLRGSTRKGASSEERKLSHAHDAYRRGLAGFDEIADDQIVDTLADYLRTNQLSRDGLRVARSIIQTNRGFELIAQPQLARF